MVFLNGKGRREENPSQVTTWETVTVILVFRRTATTRSWHEGRVMFVWLEGLSTLLTQRGRTQNEPGDLGFRFEIHLCREVPSVYSDTSLSKRFCFYRDPWVRWRTRVGGRHHVKKVGEENGREVSTRRIFVEIVFRIFLFSVDFLPPQVRPPTMFLRYQDAVI